jgi:hypothetical protein
MSWPPLPLLILACTVSSLAAQQAPLSQALDSGTVVRLIWHEGPERTGRLVARLTPESEVVVYCRYPGPPCAQGFAFRPETRHARELRSVEVRRGDRAGRGAIVGMGVGIAILGLGRWALADSDSPAPWTGQRVAGAVTFVALGAGLGALIGRRSARWVRAR